MGGVREDKMIMKTNRFGILVSFEVDGKTVWELIPWHSIESISTVPYSTNGDKLCINLRDRGVWVDSPAPVEQLETIFDDRGG